jgi:hypothetical protein
MKNLLLGGTALPLGANKISIHLPEFFKLVSGLGGVA